MRDDDDPQLAALTAHARAARARADDDPRWAALAAGELDAEAQAALRAEDPERFARYAPFAAEEDDALLGAALGALGPAGRGQAETASAAWTASSGESPLEAPMARVIRPRRWRRVALVVTPLALAAGLLVLVLGRGASPALPTYRLEDTSGDRETRSDEAVRVVRPGARLRWVLRPATPVAQAQPVHAAAWAVLDGAARRLPADFEAAPGGAVRLDAPVDKALPGRTGPVTVLLVVAPGYIELDGLDPTAPPSDVRVIKHRLDIRAE